MLTLMCLILWVTEGTGEEDHVSKTQVRGSFSKGYRGQALLGRTCSGKQDDLHPCVGGSQSDRNPDQAQALGVAGCGGDGCLESTLGSQPCLRGSQGELWAGSSPSALGQRHHTRHFSAPPEVFKA